MQTKEVKAFKKELENYKFYLSRIESLNKLIDYCYHLLGGVTAIDPSKEPVKGGTPNKDREYKIRDEISHHEKNKALTQAKIDYIDEILGKIEDAPKKLIIDVLIEGKSQRAVAIKNYMSKTSVKYQIDKNLEKALKD